MANKHKVEDQEVPALEEANRVGYLGIKVDPTPDHAYTVEGVTAGKPTPETDEKAAAKADEAASQ